MSAPRRIALVNLCEDSYGYGAGAAEYLRAHLLSREDLAEQIDVQILFLQGLDTSQSVERILEAEPELVGFSCYSWNLAASAEVSAGLRARAPELPIVWGGVSFNQLLARDDWFTWWDRVDAVAIGYAELTFEGLVRRFLETGARTLFDEPLPGFVRASTRALDGGPAPVPAELDSLASPYRTGLAAEVPRPFIEMARGCHLHCTFCSDARESRGGFWARGVDGIAEDIAAVVEWPAAEWVDAGASTANVTDQAFRDACDAIRRGDPAQRLTYSFQLYPSLVRPEHREYVDGIRIGKYLVGIQSTTPATFAPIRRGGKLEHLERAARILRGTGPVYVSVILGLPAETLESFTTMFDRLTEIEDVVVSVHRLLVLPGTPLHTRHELFDLRFDPNQFYRARSTSTMTEGDIARAQEHVMRREEELRGAGDRRPRVDWTNFDVQVRAFDPPR